MTNRTSTADILIAIADHADEIVGIDPRSKICFLGTRIAFYRHGPAVAKAIGTTYEVVGDDEVVTMHSVEDVESTLAVLRDIESSSRPVRDALRRNRICGRVVEETAYGYPMQIGEIVERVDGDRRVVSVSKHEITEAEDDCGEGRNVYLVTLEYVDAADRLRAEGLS